MAVPSESKTIQRAQDVVKSTLGTVWLARIRDQSSNDHLYRFRCVNIGNACECFRDSAGFEEYVRKLEKRETLQAVSELFTATNYHQAGFTLRFNHGQVKGEDFDLLANGPQFDVAIEVKGIGLGSQKRVDYLKTVKNTVRSAVKQLPKNGVNALSVLTAHDAMKSETLVWSMKEAILDEGLRQTGRVALASFGYERSDPAMLQCDLTNTAFPNPKATQFEQGCQVSYLLRRVPPYDPIEGFGDIPQLDIESEFALMPKEWPRSNG